MKAHRAIVEREERHDPQAGGRGVSVAILAGGRSTRFGTDKALATLRASSPSLLGTVVERVHDLTDDLFIVSDYRPAYAEFDIPIRPDLYGETGALGAVGSALRHAGHDRCLIVSCDMPLLHRGLLGWMIGESFEADALVPRTRERGRQGGDATWQTLHAIYRASCLPAIENALAGNERSIVSVFRSIRVQPIDEEVLRKFDPDLRTFFSVNTPEELQQVRGWLDSTPDHPST